MLKQTETIVNLVSNNRKVKHIILLKMSGDGDITQPEAVEKSLASSLMLIKKQTNKNWLSPLNLTRIILKNLPSIYSVLDARV